jgi:chromosome segregation ATPase
MEDQAMTDAETIADLRAELARVHRQSDWFEHRLNTLQSEQHRMRDPERMILCDILANGHLMADPHGNRYGVEECKRCAAAEEQLARVKAERDDARKEWAEMQAVWHEMKHDRTQPISEDPTQEMLLCKHGSCRRAARILGEKP